ncbi:TPA_asm: hypothetical protein vir519_00036 [Caudoviricetes sp. vir519]|nr:TPA_asm: hypothetical protein vir519_00036 [Caudoviricetes sp. vir519]
METDRKMTEEEWKEQTGCIECPVCGTPNLEGDHQYPDDDHCNFCGAIVTYKENNEIDLILV